MLKKSNESTATIKEKLESDLHSLVIETRKKLGISLTQEPIPNHFPKAQKPLFINPNCQDIPKEIMTEITKAQEEEKLNQEMEDFQLSYAVFLSKPAPSLNSRFKPDDFISLEDSEEENEDCSDYDSESDLEENPIPRL